MSRTLILAEQLISRPSVTPEDAGCLELLAGRLAPLGFTCERMDSGPDSFRVSNLWGTPRRGGRRRPRADPGVRGPYGRSAHRAAGAVEQPAVHALPTGTGGSTAAAPAT